MGSAVGRALPWQRGATARARRRRPQRRATARHVKVLGPGAGRAEAGDRAGQGRPAASAVEAGCAAPVLARVHVEVVGMSVPLEGTFGALVGRLPSYRLGADGKTLCHSSSDARKRAPASTATSSTGSVGFVCALPGAQHH